MEFHNAKLLPKGLPEIIAAFTPDEYYPDTKVIAYPRKQERSLFGQIHHDGLTNSVHLRLFPTVVAFHCHGIGTYSFQLWHELLKVTLHEIGHMATWDLLPDITAGAYRNDYYVHSHVEHLADQWRDEAMARILRVNPRLGQPLGALGGYAGVLAYKFRNGDFSDLYHSRIAEWRGLKCDGQILMQDIVEGLPNIFYPCQQAYNGSEETEEARDRIQKQRLAIERATYPFIHKVSQVLGITRFYVNKNGRRFRLFNVGEAQAVLDYAWNHRAELAPTIRDKQPKHER